MNQQISCLHSSFQIIKSYKKIILGESKSKYLYNFRDENDFLDLMPWQKPNRRLSNKFGNKNTKYQNHQRQ